MKISRYTLQFAQQKLEGMLLEEEGAYSLIQPWPLLGDASFADYLIDLKSDRTLPLTKRALEILRDEKKAKAEKRSLLPNTIPASHLLIETAEFLEDDLKSGIKSFKIKIGRNLEEEMTLLRALESKMDLGAFKLRLDANLKLSAEEADAIFSRFSEKLLCAIDFVEDPINGRPEDWLKFSERFNLRLAHDLAPEAFRNAAEVWVLKPTRENPWPLVDRAAHDLRRIVITSALDHPLGHVIAAAEAAQIAEAHPLLIDECGLISFGALETSVPFTRKGAHLDLSSLSGPGYGMDAEMKKLSWEEI